MKLRDIEKMLDQNGFVLIRSTKHRVYSNGTTKIIVPMHKEVKKFVAKQIIKEIELTQLKLA